MITRVRPRLSKSVRLTPAQKRTLARVGEQSEVTIVARARSTFDSLERRGLVQGSPVTFAQRATGYKRYTITSAGLTALGKRIKETTR